NHASHGDANLSDLPNAAARGPDDTHEPSQFAAWTEFHRQADTQPDDEREVFDLLWYQGLSQADAATLLQASERTVQRRWREARVRVYQDLTAAPPGLYRRPQPSPPRNPVPRPRQTAQRRRPRASPRGASGLPAGAAAADVPTLTAAPLGFRPAPRRPSLN